MLRYLLASTAALAIAAPAAAETISTKVTTPLKTSTVKAGTPDSITVNAQGSVVLTGGPEWRPGSSAATSTDGGSASSFGRAGTSG